MSNWKECKNILVIRLDNMGDLIMNNAALQELKFAIPDCKVTLLASEMAIPIIPFLGTVDDYMQYDAPWMKLAGQDSAEGTEVLINEIRSRQFDGCLIFNVYSQNPMAAILLAFLAGIPRRAAYMRENPYSLLTDWIPDKEPLFQVKHQITRDLDLLRHLGISYENSRLPSLKNIPQKVSLNLPTAKSKRVVLNYDVSEEKRRIAVKIAQELTQKLIDLDYQVVLIGKNDSDYLRASRQNLSSSNLINLIGMTSIADLLALLQNSDAVITVNTAVAHIGCALAKPTLVLYAQTNPQHIPWSQDSDFILYPVRSTMRSKNTINTFVDKQSKPSQNMALRTNIILQKFSVLLANAAQQQGLVQQAD